MSPTPEQMARIKEQIQKTRAIYAESASAYANMLVTGDSGTGKTQLLATAPKPVHIDSFDPGGTTTRALQPFIDSGDIIVDRYENDDWNNPQEYKRWEKTFLDRRKEGYFDCIGTYSIDSATNWVVSMMGNIMRLGKGKNVQPHAGGNPYESDYLHQQLNASNILRRDVMALPCHTLITGHLTFYKDDLTGKIETGLLMWGKLAQLFPIVFDEQYVMMVKKKAQESEYLLLTQNDGYYKAKTRMGGGIFTKQEQPDIRALLKKAGKNHEDKPKLV